MTEQLLANGEGGEQSDVEQQVLSPERMVPVSESIRYRRRAQSAEQQAAALEQKLAELQQHNEQLTHRVSELQAEQQLAGKLLAAGATDIEAAVLLAKSRLTQQGGEDLDGVVSRLKKEKDYLFGDPGAAGLATAAPLTAGAKEKAAGSYGVLERAARKAAQTGSRADLQEYLRLRRRLV
jgi:hypothetical protein